MRLISGESNARTVPSAARPHGYAAQSATGRRSRGKDARVCCTAERFGTANAQGNPGPCCRDGGRFITAADKPALRTAEAARRSAQGVWGRGGPEKPAR
uniref:Uncharacterized protein n=1 Tax=Ralstonia syzygii R24 TaxID=907261 RepID=G3A8X1_9RALS|nr:hypothetical protein RALSY_mp10223 [Ralstonia syzygii R24]